MRIVPIHPSEITATDTTVEPVPDAPARRTFGGKFPSRRTFGGKFPSRRTFGIRWGG